MIFILIFAIIFPYPPPPPIPNTTADSWIKKLGDDDFNTREHAAAELINLDTAAYHSLLVNCENSDIEISLRCKALIDQYKHIPSTSGEVPSIWFLSNELRFLEGKDAARFYYEECYEEDKTNGVNYCIDLIAKKATLKYIADLREAGLKDVSAVRILDKMIWNSKNMKKFDRPWDNPLTIPGPLVPLQTDCQWIFAP